MGGFLGFLNVFEGFSWVFKVFFIVFLGFLWLVWWGLLKKPRLGGTSFVAKQVSGVWLSHRFCFMFLIYHKRKGLRFKRKGQVAVGQNLRYLFGVGYQPIVVFFKGFPGGHQDKTLLVKGKIDQNPVILKGFLFDKKPNCSAFGKNFSAFFTK